MEQCRLSGEEGQLKVDRHLKAYLNRKKVLKYDLRGDCSNIRKYLSERISKLVHIPDVSSF